MNNTADVMAVGGSRKMFRASYAPCKCESSADSETIFSCCCCTDESPDDAFAAALALAAPLSKGCTPPGCSFSLFITKRRIESLLECFRVL